MAAVPPLPEDMQIDQEIEGLLGEDILRLTTDEINSRSRLLDNEMQSMRGEMNRLKFQSKDLSEKIKENNDKIKLNKQLPYLVGNVVEVSIALRILKVVSDLISICKLFFVHADRYWS